MQKYARVKSCEKVLLERFMVDSRLISSQVLEEFVWWYVSCSVWDPTKKGQWALHVYTRTTKITLDGLLRGKIKKFSKPFYKDKSVCL